MRHLSCHGLLLAMLSGARAVRVGWPFAKELQGWGRCNAGPTWLKVFPLYTPMTDPIISGTMIMFRRCVLTGSGFSPEAASLLAFRNFLISARGLRLSPLWNLQAETQRQKTPCTLQLHHSLEIRPREGSLSVARPSSGSHNVAALQSQQAEGDSGTYSAFARHLYKIVLNLAELKRYTHLKQMTLCCAVSCIIPAILIVTLQGLALLTSSLPWLGTGPPAHLCSCPAAGPGPRRGM